MRRRNQITCVVLVLSALLLGGCARESTVETGEPATVEPISGTSLNKLTLSDVAYRDLQIQTTAVREESVAATPGATPQRRLVIPMTALVFTADGNPFVYTSPAAKTYVRSPLVIAEYRGNDVILASGPKPGTQVVTIGDPALLGIEYGVGE
jgi:multidrug efflux pump subunit AcrA (membrane-fusion protein)